MKQDIFKERISAMTAEELIMTMVRSLEHPKIRISMGTYGSIHRDYNITRDSFKIPVCTGCAATAFACEVIGKPYDLDHIESLENRSAFLETDSKYLETVENAIDDLRAGNLYAYDNAREACDPKLPEIRNYLNISLPRLTNDYLVRDTLEAYKQLAISQPTPNAKVE